MPPVDLACLLALCDYGAVAGGGEERGNPRAAGAQALGKRALGIELKLKLASQELALELLVLAHVGRNHLPDLARAQQLAEAEAVDAGVLGDHGQALDARLAQRRDPRLGAATEPETDTHEGLVSGGPDHPGRARLRGHLASQLPAP